MQRQNQRFRRGSSGCRRGVWAVLMILAVLSPGFAQAQANQPAAIAQTAVTVPTNPEQVPSVLTVGIGGTTPFLIREGDDYRGLVLDLWEQIALINNWEYELVLQTQTQAALDAVAEGELDLLVGPFGVTAERLERVNFTQPFFLSSVGVVLPAEDPTLWSRVRPFLTTAALSSLGALLVCLFVVGNGMWLVERKHNPEQFSEKYVAGVGHGMWFALVTLTTVGYGDRAPVTPAGRFIASVWMLISVIAVSSLIGGLASAFTVALTDAPTAGITSPADLRGQQMAVVSGSTGEVWAAEYQAQLLQQPTLAAAAELVLEGKADGLVFDRPALEYYLWQYPDLPLRLADFTLSSENFAFVVPYGSPLTQELDLTIVKLRENGTIAAISDRWLQGIERPTGELSENSF